MTMASGSAFRRAASTMSSRAGCCRRFAGRASDQARYRFSSGYSTMKHALKSARKKLTLSSRQSPMPRAAKGLRVARFVGDPSICRRAKPLTGKPSRLAKRSRSRKRSAGPRIKSRPARKMMNARQLIRNRLRALKFRPSLGRSPTTMRKRHGTSRVTARAESLGQATRRGAKDLG